MENRLELLDSLFNDIQKGLLEGLPWLNKAYGRAERVVKYDNMRRRIYTPVVYVNGNDYKEVTPDSNDGNFCFFWVDDPQTIDCFSQLSFQMKADFSIIFWFDYRKIYQDMNNRNKEDIKKKILNILNGGINKNRGSFTINAVYELAENIYEGFSLDEIDNQFLMHPYGGFRFTGSLVITPKC